MQKNFNKGPFSVGEKKIESKWLWSLNCLNFRKKIKIISKKLKLAPILLCKKLINKFSFYSLTEASVSFFDLNSQDSSSYICIYISIIIIIHFIISNTMALHIAKETFSRVCFCFHSLRVYKCLTKKLKIHCTLWEVSTNKYETSFT
jgi:hypothetical protein